MKGIVYVVFVFVTLWLGCTCLQFTSSLDDTEVVYACANDTVSLPWSVRTAVIDKILDIQWFFEGRSHEIIATLANGVFFTSPAYAGRVQKTTNAGIEIQHVTTQEVGNYSVEVIGRVADGDVITLRHWVFVHIADSLQTSDGRLYLVQQPEPQYSDTSGQFHVVLTCGTFVYPSHPPFQVVWSTPTGQTTTNSTYEDGNFHLRLPNPVQGGTYNCSVPRAQACLHDNTGEATLTVDQTESRMILLDARQSRLEQKNKDLEKERRDLRREMDRLKELTRPAVSFQARMGLGQASFSKDQTVVMASVHHNTGQAYDATTGVFTAPLNATYFFLASTEVSTPTKDATLSLRVDGEEVDFLWLTSDTRTKAGGVHAVLEMQAGQRVWLESVLNSSYWNQPSSFSGFLIHPILP
ncbi:hypothetical protein ACOMHN_044900 [Nucella lapillus]